MYARNYKYLKSNKIFDLLSNKLLKALSVFIHVDQERTNKYCLMSSGYNFFVKKRRPEEIYKDVREYYNAEMISWYSTSKNIMKIQEKITRRALELLDLRKKEALILDAGCGPGFTAAYLNELGFKTVALDIIPEFLKQYTIKELNPIAADLLFLPFRPKIFTAVISISVLQWIYRETNDRNLDLMLLDMTKSLFNILKPAAKAIFQFYPKSREVIDAIGSIISDNTEFKGTFIIDNPDSPKKRKIYLKLKKKKV